jgi:CRISPR-associated protein (TIGR03986 family)
MAFDETHIAAAIKRIQRGTWKLDKISFDDLTDDLLAIAILEDLAPKERRQVAEIAVARLKPAAGSDTTGSSQNGRTDRQGVRAVPPVVVPALPWGPERATSLARPSAPFRFVTLADVVAPSEPVRRDLPVPDGFEASIEVVWAAETPLLIGEEREEQVGRVRLPVVVPMTLGGTHVIPGATLKGMLRAAIEIVAHGRIGEFANLHHRYGLRDFNHPYYAETDVMKPDRVGAGFLHWKTDPTAENGRRWVLTPLGPDRWASIEIEELLGHVKDETKPSNRVKWVNTPLHEKYGYLGMRTDLDDGTRLYDFRKSPFNVTPRKWELPDRSRERWMSHPVSTGGQPAIPVFAGEFKGDNVTKRFEYVFFDDPSAVGVELSQQAVDQFTLLNCRPSKNKQEPDGSYAELHPTLARGARIPVFYVGTPNEPNFHFGLTRLFKIAHRRSVGDVLHQSQAAHEQNWTSKEGRKVYVADYVEELFGYVADPKRRPGATEERHSPNAVARKGRIAFSFARVINPDRIMETNGEPIETIMMAPRASFAPFYLRSDSEKDYSADDAPKVAGRKRYLPAHRNGHPVTSSTIAAIGRAQSAAVGRNSGRPASPEVFSHLRFLVGRNGAEPLFASEIRLHNVRADEIGAVLFALTHGGDPTKPYRHMLGRAKAFGAGQMRVVSARLKVAANLPEIGDAFVEAPKPDERVGAGGRTGFVPQTTGVTPSGNASHRPFLAAFVERMSRIAGLESYPRTASVEEFLGSSDPNLAAGSGNEVGAGYMMDLGDFSALKKNVGAQKARKPPGEKQQKKSRPAKYAVDRDGRLLPAPRTSRPIG